MCEYRGRACLYLPNRRRFVSVWRRAKAPNAAALIRQQAHEIDDLWDRLLSRAYALVRRVSRGNDPRGDRAVAGYA